MKLSYFSAIAVLTMIVASLHAGSARAECADGSNRTYWTWDNGYFFDEGNDQWLEVNGPHSYHYKFVACDANTVTLNDASRDMWVYIGPTETDWSLGIAGTHNLEFQGGWAQPTP